MNLTFKDLEAALAPIESVGQGESTFDVGGTAVTLRVICPDEEIEVQKFASIPTQVMGDGKETPPEETTSVALEYIERFKVGLLAYAVVQVGDNDFRNVEYIETGEKLDNGAAVKIPKVQAMRRLLKRWSGPLITRMFRKYHEALAAVEHKADKAIEFAPSDLDSEIDRIERRLETLKAEKERSTQEIRGGITDKVKAIASMEEEEYAKRQDNLAQAAVRLSQDDQDVEGQPEVVSDQLLPPAARQSVVPQRAAPPPVASQPEPPAAPQPAPASAPAPGPSYDFIDPSDQEATEAAIAAENARLMAARQEMGLPTGAQESVSAAAHPQLKRPPHLAAAEVADALQQEDLQERPVEVQGGNYPAFRMPAERLDKVPEEIQPSDPGFNRSATGSTNPRFAGNRGKPSR